MTKNKKLEAVLKRFDETFILSEDNLKEQTHSSYPCYITEFQQECIADFIKAEFNDYFTARLEEVLPRKRREIGLLSVGFTEAIEQTKQNSTK